MEKLKVLHIINNLGSGGAEKLLEDMLPIMNDTKYIQTDLLLLSDKGNVFGKELKDKRVNIDVIPIKQPKNPLNIFYIKCYIENGGYNIVHAHLFPTLYWTSIASRLVYRNKPKFIYTEHSTYNKRRNKKDIRFLERFIYSNFDRIISISDSTQENLINWLKVSVVNRDKFTIINNGINMDRFKNVEPYDKIQINGKFTDKTKLLCMVGRFSEAKDQSTIIKAIKDIPGDIHLLLIGEGLLKDYNKKLAKDIGVSNRVHFLGFRDDVERILKAVDIIIQSSNWEGFGLAAVEGMAAGKPVIASNVDGLRKVVEGAGLLFEKGDIEGLCTKINELLEDRRYNNIRYNCLERAKIYDIKIMVDKYIEMYCNEYGEKF